jgi:hypothetical protein
LVLVVDALDYVVTITGLNSASFVANASTKIVQGFILAADARDYVVTIGGIEGTGVENAVFAPSASDSIVTKKLGLKPRPSRTVLISARRKKLLNI